MWLLLPDLHKISFEALRVRVLLNILKTGTDTGMRLRNGELSVVIKIQEYAVMLARFKIELVSHDVTAQSWTRQLTVLLLKAIDQPF